MKKREPQIFSIIAVLLEADDYISSGVIAEKTGISERTFFRLLPHVERILQNYTVECRKIRGKGFILHGKGKEKLISDLMKRNYTDEFSNDEKTFLVLLYLLNEKDTVKISYLARRLAISETSISKILDVLQPYLEQNGCLLLRKKGVGIGIAGNEMAIRRTALHTACLYLNFNEAMSLLYGRIHNTTEIKHSFSLYSFTAVVFDYVYETSSMLENYHFVEEIERILEISFSDTDFVAMFLYVSIMEIRCRNNFFVQPQDPVFSSVDVQSFTQLKNTTLQRSCFHNNEELLHSETVFLVEILKSTEVLAAMAEHQTQYEQIARYFISFIEDTLNGHVMQHKKVIHTVMVQIIQVLHGEKLFSGWRNTAILTENVLHKNSGIQTIIPQAAAFLQSKLNTPVSEENCSIILGFIAPFFEYNTKKISAVLVCASGIVVSSILREHIIKAFPKLETLETISIRKLTDSYIDAEGIDIVISAVPVTHLSVPVINISPHMMERDIDKIRQAIDSL